MQEAFEIQVHTQEELEHNLGSTDESSNEEGFAVTSASGFAVT